MAKTTIHSPRSPLFPLTAVAAAALLAGACVGPIEPIATATESESGTDTDTTTTTTTGPGTTTMDMTTITTLPTTTDDSASDSETTTTDATTTDATTTDATTGEPDPICGDGEVDEELGEECDDGENNADDAACTADCKNNVCGDGKVHAGVEVCDDGVNDGAYNGCEADCQALGPRCGDGIVQEEEGEVCDLPDEPESGCLSQTTCQWGQSCLQILEDNPEAVSGVYNILAEGTVETRAVYCDMSEEADGGGYTYFKVSLTQSRTAAQASIVCSGYGMTLLAPRSPAHIASAWMAATTENVTPVGNGNLQAGEEYLRVLGIHPVKEGESCVGAALNSDECPEWRSNDDQVFYISDTPIDGEPSADNCENCSLLYNWADGGVVSYETVMMPGGAKTTAYICQVGDKLP